MGFGHRSRSSAQTTYERTYDVLPNPDIFQSYRHAVLKHNSLPFLVIRWLDEHGGLPKSAASEQEILSVLSRPQIAAVTIPTFRGDLAKLLARAELVTVTERLTACRDPHNDKFLELAVNGHADLIVSGDADLLVLNPFRNIPILTPAAFMQRTAR
jgi:uncharacterized protein